MGKSKKKKKAQPNQQGGYKKFVSDLMETLALLKLDYKLFDLPPQQLRFCYESSFRVKNPQRGNDFVSAKDIKLVGYMVKYHYRHAHTDVGGCKLTFYQAGLFLSLCLGTQFYYSKKRGDDDPYVKLIKDIASLLLQQIIDEFSRTCYLGLLVNNDPVRIYYSMKRDFLVSSGNIPRIEFIIKLSAYPVREVSYKINGNARPAYRLGYSKIDGMDWVKVSARKLKNYYSGNKKELPVYIQSHAIIRMVHRLDLFDNFYLTLQFFINLTPLTNFIFYRGYILIPFVVRRIKMGYFMATIVKDVLLIRTFLFITHGSTPEGDRLRALTGMQKQDLAYWRIDRLSTFYGMKDSDIENLRDIFQKAGAEDILKVKDIKLEGLNVGPNPNLEGLVNFLQLTTENQEDELQQWDAFLEDTTMTMKDCHNSAYLNISQIQENRQKTEEVFSE